MNDLSTQQRKLTTQERHAAMLWAEGVDIDGTQVHTSKDIAKASGLTYQQFMMLKKRQDWLDEVDRLLVMQKANSARELMKAIPKAVKKLTQIMETGRDREAFQAASKILAIGGFSEHITVDLNTNDVAQVVRGGFGREELPDLTVIPIDGAQDDEP